MGQAREVMDRITEAALGDKDVDAMASLYAEDAVAVTPDTGELRGRTQIVDWMKSFVEAFPDATYESETKYEAGDTAVDEGYVNGTNTGPNRLPTGETAPATGRRIHLRSCDVATVRDGVAVSHRFYFDQMDMLDQLGLADQHAPAGG